MKNVALIANIEKLSRAWKEMSEAELGDWKIPQRQQMDLQRKI